MNKVSYGGWDNCYELSNGLVNLVITGDVGPRIIRFGFAGGANVFAEFENMMGQTGGDEWRIYGGHRLWHAPEVEPRTYWPDNKPVNIEDHGNFVRTIQEVELNTRLQKEMDIILSPDKAEVKVVHRIFNHHEWAAEFAPWALSVMAPGGVGITPLPPRGTHPENLAPGNTLTLWTFTAMNDPRWTWGEKYILLRQDPANSSPQKMGMANTVGWAAYANNGNLFVTNFSYDAKATYADMGSNFETFTNEAMLEVETLGPLTRVEPGECVEHIETWQLFGDVPSPQNDADVDAHILPLLKG
jgi:hypothetical protein